MHLVPTQDGWRIIQDLKSREYDLGRRPVGVAFGRQVRCAVEEESWEMADWKMDVWFVAEWRWDDVSNER